MRVASSALSRRNSPSPDPPHLRSPAAPQPRRSLASQLYLRPQLAHSLRRDLEVARRTARVARQESEQTLSPDRHPRSARREQRLSAEEERRLRHVDLDAL